jgi:hypothetical protein
VQELVRVASDQLVGLETEEPPAGWRDVEVGAVRRVAGEQISAVLDQEAEHRVLVEAIVGAGAVHGPPRVDHGPR